MGEQTSPIQKAAKALLDCLSHLAGGEFDSRRRILNNDGARRQRDDLESHDGSEIVNQLLKYEAGKCERGQRKESRKTGRGQRYEGLSSTWC